MKISRFENFIWWVAHPGIWSVFVGVIAFSFAWGNAILCSGSTIACKNASLLQELFYGAPRLLGIAGIIFLLVILIIKWSAIDYKKRIAR